MSLTSDLQAWLSRHPAASSALYGCVTAIGTTITTNSTELGIFGGVAVAAWNALDNFLVSGTTAVTPPQTTPASSSDTSSTSNLTPVAAGLVSTAVPTASGYPVNQALAAQLKAEGYIVDANPTMPDGIVYGIGSPAGFTWWSTQETAPILTTGPGVQQLPPGTGAQL